MRVTTTIERGPAATMPSDQVNVEFSHLIWTNFSGPDSDIATLLQPFRRGAADRTARSSGLGLGLAIVQAIADAHKASLTLEPRDRGGLTASITFIAAASGPSTANLASVTD